MDTREIVVTGTPTALTGLTDGERYTIQNLDRNGTLYVASASTQPDPDHVAFEAAPGEWLTLRPDSTSNIYVWASRPPCRAALGEAP